MSKKQIIIDYEEYLEMSEKIKQLEEANSKFRRCFYIEKNDERNSKDGWVELRKPVMIIDKDEINSVYGIKEIHVRESIAKIFSKEVK